MQASGAVMSSADAARLQRYNISLAVDAMQASGAVMSSADAARLQWYNISLAGDEMQNEYSVKIYSAAEKRS